MVARSVTGEMLYELLQQVDACSHKLEDAVLGEQQAIHCFDTIALMEFADIRHTCHQKLQELEKQYRNLMYQYNVPDELSLKSFIGIHLRDAAPDLQTFRHMLYTRMMHVSEVSEENRIHLKAAFDVTTGVLKHIGAMQQSQTYGPGKAA